MENKDENKGLQLAFGKVNYILMAVGIVVLAIGYILLAGGGCSTPPCSTPAASTWPP